MRPERDVDVLVVGSGAAGLTAALSARENGAQNVLIAESEGLVGGSSRLSGGLMMGAGTRYQRALGIEDDAESLFHEYMQLNQWKVESAVVRRLTELAGPTVEWLGDLGVQFYDQLVFGGDERVPRVHCPIGRGQAVVDVLTRPLPPRRSRDRARAAGRPPAYRGRRRSGCWRRRRRVDRRCGGGGHGRLRQRSREASPVFPVGGGDRMGLVHRGAGQPRRPPRPRRPGWRPGDGLQPRAAAAARGLREDL